MKMNKLCSILHHRTVFKDKINHDIKSYFDCLLSVISSINVIGTIATKEFTEINKKRKNEIKQKSNQRLTTTKRCTFETVERKIPFGLRWRWWWWWWCCNCWFAHGMFKCNLITMNAKSNLILYLILSCCSLFAKTHNRKKKKHFRRERWWLWAMQTQFMVDTIFRTSRVCNFIKRDKWWTNYTLHELLRKKKEKKNLSLL